MTKWEFPTKQPVTVKELWKPKSDRNKYKYESDLAMEMAEADRKGMLFKEQPFVMAIPARRVNPDFPFNSL